MRFPIDNTCFLFNNFVKIKEIVIRNNNVKTGPEVHTKSPTKDVKVPVTSSIEL